MKFCGNLVDVIRKRIYNAEVHIQNGRIVDIVQTNKTGGSFILPGFIDSHVHIESSMLCPSEFGRMVIPHGTIGILNDPHEIANVCGLDGVNYMIENSRVGPLKYFFGAPSCVPATLFETSGAFLGVQETEKLLKKMDIYFLSEVMNYPAVISADPDMIEKIRLAKYYHKPIDGHAPSLYGKSLIKYIAYGITTDHECTNIQDARDRIRLGMKIMIREGSAVKNFETLMPLLEEFPESCMLCSDDRHPTDLFSTHIEGMVQKAAQSGISIWNILQAACVNPVYHYKLPLGLLQIGDSADFIVVDNVKNFTIERVVINGEIVFSEGKTVTPYLSPKLINHFEIDELSLEDIQTDSSRQLPIVGVIDGQIMTERLETVPNDDVLKIVCVNRYKKVKPSIAYIHGFGLKEGAIGSSVAHDSHNIVAVGTNDRDILRAINQIIQSKGGVIAVSPTKQVLLPLPIAGLMSNLEGEEVHTTYKEVEELAKEFGSTLTSPLMTLSFMALLVIPKLKLSDKGLFDSEKFQFIRPE